MADMNAVPEGWVPVTKGKCQVGDMWFSTSSLEWIPCDKIDVGYEVDRFNGLIRKERAPFYCPKCARGMVVSAMDPAVMVCTNRGCSLCGTSVNVWFVEAFTQKLNTALRMCQTMTLLAAGAVCGKPINLEAVRAVYAKMMKTASICHDCEGEGIVMEGTGSTGGACGDVFPVGCPTCGGRGYISKGVKDGNSR